MLLTLACFLVNYTVTHIIADLLVLVNHPNQLYNSRLSTRKCALNFFVEKNAKYWTARQYCNGLQACTKFVVARMARWGVLLISRFIAGRSLLNKICFVRNGCKKSCARACVRAVRYQELYAQPIVKRLTLCNAICLAEFRPPCKDSCTALVSNQSQYIQKRSASLSKKSGNLRAVKNQNRGRE